MNNRRDFLGVLGGAVVLGPLALPHGRRRFRHALKRVIAIKQNDGEIRESEANKYSGALDNVVDGSTVSDHVFRLVRQEEEIPWWRNLVDWVMDNWQLILRILLMVILTLEQQ